MLKKILFAAGDPGGANAVRPVAEYLSQTKNSVLILDHGVLAQGIGSTLALVQSDEPFDTLCFATSLKDTLPLELARSARQQGKKVVAVLDNWVNYRSRLEMDGLPLFLPDVYAVMDQKAKTEAIEEGVPDHCLAVTGHPNLASLEKAAKDATDQWRQHIRHRIQMGLNGRGLIVFVNEPAAKDQGMGSDNPNWRGYTERDALAALAQGLENADVDIAILPHPRDDVQDVAALWNQVRGPCTGNVVTGITGRDLVLAADRTAGMISILLYESWLVGRPTLSLQPGLVRQDLLSIAGRPGIVQVRTFDQIRSGVGAWLVEENGPAQSDLRVHAGAAKRIADLLVN